MGPAMSRPPPRPTAYGLLVAPPRSCSSCWARGSRARSAGRIFGAYFLVSALMLAAGILVYRQNPAARPNR